MRWNLWLAQPETERSLQIILRITMAAVVSWTVIAAYGVWNTRTSLAATQTSVLLQTHQILQMVQDLPGQRREALKAAKLNGLPSQSIDSAEVTESLTTLARNAGAEVQSVRIGDSGETGAAAQASPAPMEASSQSHETFECNLTGKYPSLTRFLNGLAASHQILDITSLQITQGSVKITPGSVKITPDDAGGQQGSARVEMKIMGTVYETSEKL